MTSLLAKAALATAVAIATVGALIGISGSIIFADLRAPQPTSVVQDGSLPASVTTKPLTITGPMQ